MDNIDEVMHVSWRCSGHLPNIADPPPAVPIADRPITEYRKPPSLRLSPLFRLVLHLVGFCDRSERELTSLERKREIRAAALHKLVISFGTIVRNLPALSDPT
jgi:hypothetical protein